MGKIRPWTLIKELEHQQNLPNLVIIGINQLNQGIGEKLLIFNYLVKVWDLTWKQLIGETPNDILGHNQET